MSTSLPGTWIGSGFTERVFNWMGSVAGPQFLHDKPSSDDFYFEKKDH